MKKIQVLGTGCPKCNMLFESVKAAAEDVGGGYEIEKIMKINDIMAFGVMVTPALVIDGDVKAVGKVPTVDEIKAMLV
ncbi:MAG: TM0996/MTH895 family glutaredoxin-like protein [Anaerohalosphaera sp.]|nr:TM0996/MTH895 family glutaredoxin-like protein [Anaerohalosphaera sp.]